MTYLIIGENKESQIDVLDILFQKFFEESFRELTEKADIPDIHILDGREKTSIGIEEVKDLQSELFFHPFEKEFQTGVVLEAEKLTAEAQNAFLKTLEESNDQTIFILCTKNEKNLLPTIVSRSRKIFAPKNIDSQGDIPASINLGKSLVEIFGKIEDVAQDSEKSLDFLKSLEYLYKEKLEDMISKNDKELSILEREHLKDIQTARIRILANGNRRLVLENLILRLRK